MGACQLGAGVEVVGRRERLTLERGREVRTELCSLEKADEEAGP